MTKDTKSKLFSNLRKVPSQIWILGWVSLFSDASTEMINSVLPLYITTVLGATVIQFGMMEGMLEAFSLIIKMFSGVVSDVFRGRKLLTILGYGLAAISKPFVPMASSYEMIFGARIVDRMGKGIRGVPRDALIAENSPSDMHGASFGLRQGMDTGGAFIGPLMAMSLMVLFHFEVKSVLWFAVLPIWLSVFLLIVGVRETNKKKSKTEKKFQFKQVFRLPRTFWFLILLIFVMALAKCSDAFLLLKARELNISVKWIPMVMILMNVVYAFSSYPLGSLSDRIGRLKLVGSGIIFLIVADLILSHASNSWMLTFGVIAWGLHLGATQGVLSAMVVDVVPETLRGTCLGIFYLVSGVGVLISSSVAGWIWEQNGSQDTYLASAICSGVALGLFVILVSRKLLKEVFV